MPIDNAISALFSWNLLLFALGINVITWILRTITEFVYPPVVNALVYQKLFLPLSPALLGVVISIFAIHYAYPDNLSSFSGRAMFGLVAGSFASLAFQVVKGMFKEKIQAMKNQMNQTNGGNGNSQQ